MRRHVREDRCLAGLVVATLVLAGLLYASLAGAQTPPPPPPDPSPLSELELVRAENLKLKAQILDLQRALAQAQLDAGTAALNAERTALEAAFRLSLKAKAGETFNWQTLRFEPPKEAPSPGR